MMGWEWRVRINRLSNGILCSIRIVGLTGLWWESSKGVRAIRGQRQRHIFFIKCLSSHWSRVVLIGRGCALEFLRGSLSFYRPGWGRSESSSFLHRSPSLLTVSGDKNLGGCLISCPITILLCLRNRVSVTPSVAGAFLVERKGIMNSISFWTHKISFLVNNCWYYGSISLFHFVFQGFPQILICSFTFIGKAFFFNTIAHPRIERVWTELLTWAPLNPTLNNSTKKQALHKKDAKNLFPSRERRLRACKCEGNWR